MDRKHKYRFKTREEFITEYGDEWRMKVRCMFVVEMDTLLGVDIDEKYDKKFNYLFDDGNWHFHIDFRGNDKRGREVYCNVSIDMVKKIQISPSYEPKKFVY